MPPTPDIQNISDFTRDAQRYYRTLLALDSATTVIGDMEQQGHPDINEVLDKILPSLAVALNAEQAFAAVLRKENGKAIGLELTTVHPRSELRGHFIPYSELFQQIVQDGKAQVIDPLDKTSSEIIPELESLGATSAILVRMRTTDRVWVVGICNKANPDIGPYLAVDKWALENIIELVAIGARVGEQRKRELGGIQTTLTAISTELDLDELLPMIANGAADVFDAPATSVMLWDEGQENLVIRVSYGLSDQYVRQLRIPQARVQSTIASLGGIHPIVTPDLRLGSFGQTELIESEHLCSVLSAPMKVYDELIGVLNIYSKDKPREFVPSEIELAEISARQAAIAIQNARLRLHELESLEATSAAISAATDLNQVGAAITQAVCFVTEADESTVVLLDHSSGKLKLYPHIASVQPRWQRHLMDLDLSREIIQFGKVVSVSDLRQVASVNPELIKTGICAFIGVPIRGEQENIGVLYAYSRKPGHFESWRTVALLKTMAGQASLAIANARLYDETQRRARRLDALQKLALDLNSSVGLNKTLEATCRAATEFFNADHSGLVLFGPDLIQGQVKAEYPALGTYDKIIPLSGIPAEQRLITSLEPLVIDDVAGDDSLGQVRDILQSLNAQSALIVPVISKEGILRGSFSLDSLGRPRQFNQEEVELCKIFAAHVAVAIENAQLFESVTQGQAYIQSLYEASSAIILPMEPREVLQTIVDTARNAMNAWRAIVLLMDEGCQPRAIAQSGFNHPLDLLTICRPGGISHQVVQSRQPRFIPNIQASTGEIHPRMFQQGTRAAACLPLLLRDRAIGVLWAQFREPHIFSVQERQAMQVYASQAAIAYDHAQHMQELEHLRLAAENLANVAGVQEVLQQIVESATEVLGADSAVIWSYDNARRVFLPDEFVAGGIPQAVAEQFRRDEPRPDGTAETVMDQGYLAVTDIHDSRYDFLGLTARGLREAIGVSAFQGIPLRVAMPEGSETLGVLYVDYVEPRHFSADDKITLETFVYHATLALKRARLLEQVKRTKHAVEVVADVTVQEDLQTTLNTIVQDVREILRSDAISLYSYDEAKDQLGPWAIDIPAQFDPDSATASNQLRAQSVVWTILRLTGPQYYHMAEEGAGDDPLLGGRFVHTENIQAAFGIQLRAGERKVGVMFVNYRSRHRFPSDEIDTIELFANQAAVAIRNAQLYEETNRRANALQALYEAGQAVNSTLTLQEILDRVTQQARRLVGGGKQEGCFSHLALKAGSLLQFTAACPQDILDQLKNKISDIDLQEEKFGISGRVAKTGVAQNVGDVTHDPDYILFESRTHSEMAVPIKIDEQVFGVINVEHPDYNAFQQEDLYALDNLAAQAAVAIGNANRYKELEDTRDRMLASEAVAWLGLFGADWQHEINQKIFSIRNYANGLRSWLSKRDGPADINFQVHQAIELIEKVADGIKSIKFTNQVPYRMPGEPEEQTLLDEELHAIVERWCHGRPDVKPSLHTHCPGTKVKIPPQWIGIAMEKLINNALKAMPDGGQLIITTQLVDKIAHITIRDTGRGIPSNALPYFLKSTVPRTEGQSGTGMGALIARFVVLSHGGNLTLIESHENEGTQLLMTLPVAENEVSWTPDDGGRQL